MPSWLRVYMSGKAYCRLHSNSVCVILIEQAITCQDIQKIHGLSRQPVNLIVDESPDDRQKR